jgi:putative spermidine/putrescine transport system substrate-binding protein
LDVNRAFKSLDKIKPYVRVWWLDGSQPSQLLTADQVALSSAWNGRLFAARKEGAQISWSWKGSAIDLDWWIVPKGAHAKKAAERLIWHSSQPYTMALQAEMVGYGPANKEALRFVSSETQAYLPTQPINFAQGFLVDSNWWADNESEVQRRWVEWKGK